MHDLILWMIIVLMAFIAIWGVVESCKIKNKYKDGRVTKYNAFTDKW